MKKTTGLLLFPTLASALTEGAAGYATQQLVLYRSKFRRGNRVCCHICGESSVTLYKRDGQYICKRCKVVAEP